MRKISIDPEIHEAPYRPQRESRRKILFPFREMKKGQSFTTPLSQKGNIHIILHGLNGNTSREFLMRQINAKQVRVWRIR